MYCAVCINSLNFLTKEFEYITGYGKQWLKMDFYYIVRFLNCLFRYFILLNEKMNFIINILLDMESIIICACCIIFFLFVSWDVNIHAYTQHTYTHIYTYNIYSVFILVKVYIPFSFCLLYSRFILIDLLMSWTAVS